MLPILRVGADQPGGGREAFRLVGDLTALADGRLVLPTPDGEAHGPADALAALVGEEPDEMGDRHIGRVSWCSRCSTGTKGRAAARI